MHLPRRLLAHRSLALLVCLAALAMKLLVPAGYMIASEHGRLGIVICPGTSIQSMTPTIDDNMAGHVMTGDEPPRDHGSSKEHGKAEIPCAFSSLSAQTLGAVDPILLAAAIMFAVAIGLRAILWHTTRPTRYLRPPLRGPPAPIG